MKLLKSSLAGEREPQRLIFVFFNLELNAFVVYLEGASFNTDRHTGPVVTTVISANFQSKLETHFVVR